MVNQSAEWGVTTTCTTQSLEEFLIEDLLNELGTKVTPIFICPPGNKCKGKEVVRKRGRERKEKETKGR